MYQQNIKSNGHDWQKQNLVTLKGGYDKVKCSKCGLEAKRLLETVFITENRKNTELMLNCINSDFSVPKRIKIIIQPKGNPAFGNLIENSIHEVIDAPSGYTNTKYSVWVAGINDIVRLLSNEFEILS
jgi:ribosomal protein S26